MPPAGVSGGRRVEHRVHVRRGMVRAWQEATLWTAVLFAPGLLLVPMVRGEPPGDPSDAALLRWLVVIWVVALCLVMVGRIHALAQHLARQYLQADEHGLLLVQHRLWWFPGRELMVAWSDIRSVECAACFVNDAPRRLLVVYLTDAGAGRLTRVPSFMLYRSRDQGWSGTARLPRLILQPGRRQDTIHEVLRVVRQVHPGVVDTPHEA